jgi:hypothetical protein
MFAKNGEISRKDRFAKKADPPSPQNRSSLAAPSSVSDFARQTDAETGQRVMADWCPEALPLARDKPLSKSITQ